MTDIRAARAANPRRKRAARPRPPSEYEGQYIRHLRALSSRTDLDPGQAEREIRTVARFRRYLRGRNPSSPYSAEVGALGLCHECGRNAVGRCAVVRQGRVVGDYGYCGQHRTRVQRDCRRAPNPGKAARAERRGYGLDEKVYEIQNAMRRRTMRAAAAAEAEAPSFFGTSAMRELGQHHRSYGRRVHKPHGRRRNPSHGDWIDLVVPVIALYLLLRNRIIQPTA